MEGLRKVEAKPKDRMPVIVAIAEASAIAIPVKHDNPTPVEHYNPTPVEHYNPNYCGKSVELIQQKPASSRMTKKNRDILITVLVTTMFIYIINIISTCGKYGVVAMRFSKRCMDLDKYMDRILIMVSKPCPDSISMKEVMQLLSEDMTRALSIAEELRLYIVYKQENKEKLTKYGHKAMKYCVSKGVDAIEKVLNQIKKVAYYCDRHASNRKDFDNDCCVNMFLKIYNFIRSYNDVLEKENIEDYLKMDSKKFWNEKSLEKTCPKLCELMKPAIQAAMKEGPDIREYVPKQLEWI